MEKTEFILNSGPLFGIVLTLRMYKSLSAPEISKIMDIKKTTLFNYLNQLEEEGFIEMDEEKSHEEWKELGARARKYFRATPLIEKVLELYSQDNPSYEEMIEEIKMLPEILKQDGGMEAIMVSQVQALAKEKIDLGSFVRVISQMNSTIINITYAELEKLIEQASKGDITEEIQKAVQDSVFSPKTTINILPFFIDLQTVEQAIEFQTTFRQFQHDIFEMKARFDKENENNSTSGENETQYLFMFAAPVNSSTTIK